MVGTIGAEDTITRNSVVADGSSSPVVVADGRTVAAVVIRRTDGADLAAADLADLAAVSRAAAVPAGIGNFIQPDKKISTLRNIKYRLTVV